ncbi:hypothetical protein AVEN_62945-1 [Araneus ventricosus]|uniref:Uncharacterized protein n=1 Tax=Araneus ventricosus TaxID=182803 RepID=A0A4Y2WKU3_ARAVE|nr:hypothetical protein AVEN_62945-1 [Araneus ventricosus]
MPPSILIVVSFFSFLRHLPSEARGVADQLFLGDSSPAISPEPPSAFFSGVDWKQSRVLTGVLCRRHAVPTLQGRSPVPLWACIRPSRSTLTFDMASLGDFCVVLSVERKEVG